MTCPCQGRAHLVCLPAARWKLCTPLRWPFNHFSAPLMRAAMASATASYRCALGEGATLDAVTAPAVAVDAPLEVGYGYEPFTPERPERDHHGRALLTGCGTWLRVVVSVLDEAVGRVGGAVTCGGWLDGQQRFCERCENPIPAEVAA